MSATSIGDALFTKTQQRLLTLLYGQPDQSFYLNELVGLAQVGRGAVSRELAKLKDSGLVNTTRRGNQVHYQANDANPIYDELTQIVQKTFGITDLIHAALQPIATSLEQAFIYGSIAKGEAHADSDVDLMLVGHDLSYSAIMELLEPVEKRLRRTINPTLYSPDDLTKRIEEQQSFVTRVMDQPRINLKFKQ
ncbi:MAG: nucleotidyltransferase domain-containing protein [Pseudomonadales bacterium]|uniref:nucleotidyltransferase domain-containing protein n=1 Tax=Marinobacter xestospongiae TaxID=994319 RepID=UPI0020048620|nr:nucleotidyltransferase domain-containing protein [Marinobacter xestospongiae]MCG8519248.1 nucleotidyltransferase domain-containing protein [Pseudomonadales bacterium]MCK7566361.1 nucleotidyltransferase domain-containing protein [Marinobacter xestospongiae]